MKQNSTKPIERLTSDQKSVLITEKGLPTADLTGVGIITPMQDRLALLDGISRGEKAFFDGRTFSHGAARKKMARWLR